MSEKFGAKIRELRCSNHWSLYNLARNIGMSRSYLWELEQSNCKNPTADILLPLSKALGVTVDYLIDDAATLSDEIRERAFFNRFNHLSPPDKARVELLIDTWGKLGGKTQEGGN